MRKIIRTIGQEGRTTIPQCLRDAMGIHDGDFLAFELTQDGKHLVVTRVGMCPHSEMQPTRQRITPHSSDHRVMMTTFVPSIDPEDLEKVLYVLEHILGLGGDSK